MFGYINVNGAQLSEENKKIYQSYYCGLCRKLKEFCGKKGQALLNYDMTFLVVLLTGLYEPDTQTGEFTCMMHPMKKRQLRENDIQSYAAQMNVLLAYYNLVDDWKDDHNYTKKTIASMFEKDYQRIKINYPRQTNAIEQYMEKLAAYEAEKQTNIDLVAGLTGEMLGEIFAWKQDEWYDELKTLGFYLGKFIYLMDAYEDLEKDLRKFYPNMLPMGAGCCTKCKTCTYPEAPCRFPDQAFSSMEAYGMLVMQVCQANHLDYYYGPGKIAYASCYLLK